MRIQLMQLTAEKEQKKEPYVHLGQTTGLFNTQQGKKSQTRQDNLLLLIQILLVLMVAVALLYCQPIMRQDVLGIDLTTVHMVIWIE